MSLNKETKPNLAESAGAVEYTNYISAEGQDSLNEFSMTLN